VRYYDGIDTCVKIENRPQSNLGPVFVRANPRASELGQGEDASLIDRLYTRSASFTRYTEHSLVIS
jgi:hypothetical protein